MAAQLVNPSKEQRHWGSLTNKADGGINSLLHETPCPARTEARPRHLVIHLRSAPRQAFPAAGGVLSTRGIATDFTPRADYRLDPCVMLLCTAPKAVVTADMESSCGQSRSRPILPRILPV
jgi:hypothetical protein